MEKQVILTKKKYTAPHVTDYGHVLDITKGAGGMKGDGGTNMSRM